MLNPVSIIDERDKLIKAVHLSLCLLLRGEGGGHQGGDEVVHDGTRKGFWRAGHPV